MSLARYQSDWVSVFNRHGIDNKVANEEFSLWVQGLDGEINNEHTQTSLSVAMAAEDAVAELKGDS